MKTTYEVNLSNRNGIFDTAEGFETIGEALKWSMGRSGCYNIFMSIEGKENGMHCDPINCDYDNNLSWFDGWNCIDLTFEEAVNFFYYNL